MAEARKTLRPDNRGRIMLGGLATGMSSFMACRDLKGRIVLKPQIEVPTAEAWLWQNSAAMKSLQQGLNDSSEGKLVDRGSFAVHAQGKRGVHTLKFTAEAEGHRQV